MAQNLTVLTLNEPNVTDFAEARNELLLSAQTDWVLFLDSDEKLSPQLEAEIKQVLSNPKFSAYSIPRLDSFLGRPLIHGEAGSCRLVRLARRDWGKWERSVHEIWVGKSPVGKLSSPILHSPHPDLRTFVSKIDKYSSLAAHYRYQQRIKSSLFKIYFYPLAKFKYNYFLKLGFLDGVPGFIHALMMSWHSYLTWTKLYLLWHKK